MKKLVRGLLLAALALGLTACSKMEQQVEQPIKPTYEDAIKIEITESSIKVDEKYLSSVFETRDVIYYKDIKSYASGNPYGEGIFLDAHSEEDANKVRVINIVEPGVYRLSGTLENGQIKVDLGEDAKHNPDAVVTLILDNININCSMAPAILFLNAYECDGERTVKNAIKDVDTSAAGANIIIADNSINNISGSYVSKIYKDNNKKETLWEQDGAIYSYVSMNIDGDIESSGVLNVNAQNEGIGSELHITVNGGNINVISTDDGFNANADNMSVIAFNGGNIRIIAGTGREGDGVDSNGWIVINDGVIFSVANPKEDGGLDSDLGSIINGGEIFSLGGKMDWGHSDSAQTLMNIQFEDGQYLEGPFVIQDDDDNIIFACDMSQIKPGDVDRREFNGLIFSSPKLKIGKSYKFYLGGVLLGECEEGIYDINSIWEYREGKQFGSTSERVDEKPLVQKTEMDEIRENAHKNYHNMTEEERAEFRKSLGGNRIKGTPETMTKAERDLFGNIKESHTQNKSEPKENNQDKFHEIIPVFKLKSTINNFSGVTIYE